ncbi:MAG TPA: metallophosphoesterase, partial [Flavitalea sp.]|nr:metallophosphoesterase [Flavitalea sp.]
GTNSSAQANVRNAYQAYNGTNYTDVWMLLGDNAYNNGLDTEYGNNFFNVYEGSLTKNHVLWPAPGNHDYANTGARQADHQIPYYDLFSLPTKGEAGGVPSNSEAFYSYDYGNIHFVSLDSYGWEAGNTRLYDTTGAQATWLKQDLAANKQKWTVVYFHHPPYTKGSHNSDTEQELVSLRQKLVPILERYKVDLVLSGHSHSYERSFMINGHYGLETTFDTTSMAFSNSSGKYDGSANSCLYVKKESDAKNRIVYAVVGSSGQVNGSTAGYPHNAMQYSNITNTGALVIEIEGNRLDAKWICNDGVSRDQFTIVKEAGKTIDTTIALGSQLVLTATWQGTYQWSNGATTRSITVNPATNTSYSVTDGAGCLTDVYNVTVTGAAGIANNGASAKEANALQATALNVRVAPNPSAGLFFVTLETNSTDNIVLSVSDLFGRPVHLEKGAPKKVYNIGRTLAPGMYILRIEQGNKSKTIKIIKQ